MVCMDLGASTSPIAASSPQLSPVSFTLAIVTLVFLVLTYGLLSGLCDVLVRFEERSDVHGLSAPDVSVDGPVEGELEGTAVEVAVVW